MAATRDKMERAASVLSLPLHPRRAHQLFQEILLTDTELTPQLSDMSLPLRLHEFQRRNLIGIQEAKRGTTFQRIRVATDSTPHTEAEEVTLQLSSDGSTLHITAENEEIDAASIRLLDVKGIVLQTEPMGFSLELEPQDDTRSNNIDVFVAASVESFNRWMVALTCGVNAFQQQKESSGSTCPDSKAADLVWQAVRLRIFELTDVIPLSRAVKHVASSIPAQDQQDETLRQRSHFLRCIN